MRVVGFTSLRSGARTMQAEGMCRSQCNLWDFADRTRVAREYPATNQRERRGAVLEELRSDVSTCVHAGTWVSCPLRPDAPCVPVRR